MKKDNYDENKVIKPALGIFDQLLDQQSQSNGSQITPAEAHLSTDDNLVANNNLDEPADSNDAKGMSPEARRALVSLLRLGVIHATKKAKIFESICRYQLEIRQHLADMYLNLTLDDKAGIAFVSSVEEDDFDDDDEPVSLITRRTLTLYDTLLLLVLRKYYQERELSGEHHVVIDIERVESYLTPFLPLTNSMKSDKRKLGAAMKRMVEKRILSSVRSSDDRFEITPIIRYVVNADFLEEMLEEYNRIAIENGVNVNKEDNHHAE